MRVQIGAVRRQLEGLDAHRLQDGIESGAEFGIAIVQEMTAAPRNPTSASERLRAICSIQRRSGEVVMPPIHTRREATRMQLRT